MLVVGKWLPSLAAFENFNPCKVERPMPHSPVEAKQTRHIRTLYSTFIISAASYRPESALIVETLLS